MTSHEGLTGNSLGLRRYTKDVPPGWNPGAYPITEYFELLKVWVRLTKLDEEQIGAAVMSRLQGRALRLAHAKKITRLDPLSNLPRNYTGVEALILPESEGQYDVHGNVTVPGQSSGLRQFLDDLTFNFEVEDQDMSWIVIDRFFTYKRSHDEDFLSYSIEWNRRFGEAEDKGGLNVSEPAKAWLFWTNAGVSEQTIADLRLKVNGDLTRWREMVNLQQKITKNENAARDQDHGYRKSLPSYHNEEYTDDYDYDYDAYAGDYDYAEEYDWEQAEYEGYYGKGKQGKKGKGKGQFDGGKSDDKPNFGKGKGSKHSAGDQCSVCGSKYHRSSDCPCANSQNQSHFAPEQTPGGSVDAAQAEGDSWQETDWQESDWTWDDYWGGKGKGKRRKGKGKGKGKRKGGKPRFPRPMGSSGKGNGYKGKRRSYYESEQYLNFPVASDVYPYEGDEDLIPEEDEDEEEEEEIQNDESFDIEQSPATEPHTPDTESRRDSKRRMYNDLFGPKSTPPTPVVTSPSVPDSTSTSRSMISPSSGTQPSPTKNRMFDNNSPVGVTVNPELSQTCMQCGKPQWKICSTCTKTFCQMHGCFLNEIPECFRCMSKKPVSVASHVVLPGDEPNSPQLGNTDSSNGLSSSFELVSTPGTDGNLYNYFDRVVNADHTVVLPTFSNNKYMLLMTVRGKTRQGLIVDPGAARGVIGCDVLQDIVTHLLQPYGYSQWIQWTKSFARFSGISSSQEASQGLCSLPIGLTGIDWSLFHTDVLGGNASLCPGLVPLHSLMTNAEFMHFAFFSNGDGILGLRHCGRIEPQRLCLTDSGHYLLPIDQFGVPSDYRLNEAIANRLYNHLMSSGHPRRDFRCRQTGGSTVALPVFVDEQFSHSDFQ
jgi:hypothetical protein